MSTRSGKRLHNSTIEEDIVDIPIPRRKTRNNKLKDNCENIETVSKKKHYVRYPSEEDSISENHVSKAKKPQRATLQEINGFVEETESDQKPTRATRRTKKIEADTDNEVIVELKKKGKKKNVTKDSISYDENANKNENGNKNKVSKKKKKKRSTSIVVEEVINPILEKSNTSVDSFHSAAGSTFESPSKYDEEEQAKNTLLNCENNTNHSSPKVCGSVIESLKKSFKPEHNNDVSDILAINENITEKAMEKNPRKKRSRKRSLSPQIVATEDNVSKKVKSQEVGITHTNKSKKKKSKKSQESPKESEIETVLNTTFEKENCTSDKNNSTFDKITENANNTTYDKESEELSNVSRNKGISTINSSKLSNISISKPQKSNSLNSTYDKTPDLKNSSINNKNMLNNTFEKHSISINSTFEKVKTSPKLNSTFEKAKPSPKLLSNLENDKKDSPKLNSTFDKENENSKLNTTFDKSSGDIKKSSLRSSDCSNITNDKSNDSRISITSDESKENIVNTTPVLIESSMEESLIMEKDVSVEKEKSPKDKSIIKDNPPITPLKKEGTFTKESHSPRTTLHKTPSKRMSVPSPGRTPFPASKGSSKEKNLNVTRSIEKSRRSSILDLPRATKVMFCSPVNIPMIASQMTGKVIKSNLKGSSKSFIFNESVTETLPSARKRSYTQSDVEEVTAKRKRLAEDIQNSVDRLSRPRTTSASGKLQDQTPSKQTPQKTKEAKVRTKLPNFAALHQKQFSKMESLDECQQRKARRAQQMLAVRNVSVERKSPKDKETKSKETKKVQTPVKTKLPTLESLNPGYTRFGFKMNSDGNPFTNTTNNDLNSTKNDLNSTKHDVNTTKSNPNSTKTNSKSKFDFNSTKIDLNSTKADFNTTKNGVNSFRTTKSVFNPPLNSIKVLKPKENKLKGLKRQTELPSLAGTTVRKEIAKQTIMREKSFTDKRNESRKENRTIIKGVRTNRRFELQMKSRNIN